MSKAKKYYELIAVEPKNYQYKADSHRYVLSFQSKAPLDGKSAAVIQMNGSTASPKNNGRGWVSDPTIGKVLTWCYENNHQNFDVVHCMNMFSYVETHPNKLKTMNSGELNTPSNDYFLETVCKSVDFVILAYGDCKGIDPEIVSNRKKEVLDLLQGLELFNVGQLTKKKNPRHGRSWNNNPELMLYRKN